MGQIKPFSSLLDSNLKATDDPDSGLADAELGQLRVDVDQSCFLQVYVLNASNMSL